MREIQRHRERDRGRESEGARVRGYRERESDRERDTERHRERERERQRVREPCQATAVTIHSLQSCHTTAQVVLELQTFLDQVERDEVAQTSLELSGEEYHTCKTK